MLLLILFVAKGKNAFLKVVFHLYNIKMGTLYIYHNIRQIHRNLQLSYSRIKKIILRRKPNIVLGNKFLVDLSFHFFMN